MPADRCLRCVLVICTLLLLPHDTLSAGNNCKGQPNLNPIASADPVLVKTVPNGKLFKAGGDIVKPNVFVAHVYGTPYEMGYAHGMLLKDEITKQYDDFMVYLSQEVEGALKSLPKWLQKLIATDGVQAALEVTVWLTKPHIPDYINEEVNGLAAALNRTADSVMRIMLFPELIQAHCSMMGAWGSAIAKAGGTLQQLRALDWGTSSPLQQYPLVLVYHPTQAGNGHPFLSVTWAGFIGAITGFSSAQMAICEKVWLHYKGKQNRAGVPWHFLLRNILQFDESIDQAVARMENATRTCSIFVGVGQASPNPSFNAIEYSYEGVTVFNDHNMSNHTQFQDLVYVDKHTQPSSDPCMPALIQEYYGSLNATVIFQYITAQFQTGDMHLAVFDYGAQQMYVANAAPVPANGTAGIPAYNRAFVQLDLSKLFATKL